MVWHGGSAADSGPWVVCRKDGVGAAARVLRGGCVGGVPGKHYLGCSGRRAATPS